MSARSMSSAPNIPAAGIRYLLSEPTIILATCGATNPTKPMTPVKLTTVAATTVTSIRSRSLSFSTSIPNVLALSSPVPMTLSLLAMSCMMIEPATVTRMIIGRLS